MNKIACPLKLPASVKIAAQRLAREDGISLNQWISVAVAEKVSAMEKRRLPFSSAQQGMLSLLTCYPFLIVPEMNLHPRVMKCR